MDKKTQILLVIGLGVGAYLLYKKQSGATPFTWLPTFGQPQSTGPISNQQAPVIATGIAAGASLLPSALNAATTLGSKIANLFSYVPANTAPVDYSINSPGFQEILGQAIVQQSQGMPDYGYGTNVDYSDPLFTGEGLWA